MQTFATHSCSATTNLLIRVLPLLLAGLANTGCQQTSAIPPVNFGNTNGETVEDLYGAMRATVAMHVTREFNEQAVEFWRNAEHDESARKQALADVLNANIQGGNRELRALLLCTHAMQLVYLGDTDSVVKILLAIREDFPADNETMLRFSIDRTIAGLLLDKVRGNPKVSTQDQIDAALAAANRVANAYDVYRLEKLRFRMRYAGDLTSIAYITHEAVYLDRALEQLSAARAMLQGFRPGEKDTSGVLISQEEFSRTEKAIETTTKYIRDLREQLAMEREHSANRVSSGLDVETGADGQL